MAAQQLPERPNLEQLKRQAKDLLRDAHANDPAARQRFRILPSFSARSEDELARTTVALHDAQSVIAREYGFDSWNAIREHVEESVLEFAAAVDQFVEAATGDRPDRAARLLAMHPAIARASLYAALVAGNTADVNDRLKAQPTLATAPGGPRGWEPLHYVCHAAVDGADPSRDTGLAEIARHLIALGADVNTRFPWPHHGVHRPVLWGAVFSARSMALARALLEAGADPSDGVTLPVAASAGNIEALELLHSYGASVNHPWATDGSAPLYAILHWSRTSTGVQWLLAHGADPDPVFAANGETPLHVVAASWDPALAEAFVNRGAEVTRRRADGRTPYAVAELNGNRATADWLAAHGGGSEISAVDRLVGLCSRGDHAGARAMIEKRPELRTEIATEHYAAFFQAAERNDTAALETMLACGFDPNRGDESIGKTALHAAAMEGWPDAVRVLLSHGASVSARDREFRAQPLIWAAEGSRMPRTDRDHAAVGRLLLDAGSPTDWEALEQPTESIREIVNTWRAIRNTQTAV